MTDKPDTSEVVNLNERRAAKLLKPDSPAAKLRDFMRNSDDEKATQAQVLLSLAADAELFHDADGTAYARFKVAGHHETWPIRRAGFRRWLRHRFYELEDKPPGAQALEDAIGVLEARAQFDAPEATVHVRVAEHDGAVYIDLTDTNWQAVKVTPNGWRVVTDPPVRFVRSRGMQPLPVPIRGGTIEELRPFINAADDETWTMIVSWLMGALSPRGPYPILTVQGEQGSAKSTLSRIVRSLVDPSTVALRSTPREERDLAITASRSWVVAYDNLSGLSAWLSDALCRLSTGGGFGGRELYSDAEEVLFNYTRPAILNGISNVAERPDLVDRSLLVTLPALADDQRRDEQTLYAEFEKARPRIFGAMLDAVAAGLRNRDKVKLKRLPRMADFAKWVVACEEALPWSPGTFIKTYQKNRASAVDETIEADAVASAVRDYAGRVGEWTGTATVLLDRLTDIVGETVQKSRQWPKTPQALGRQLRRAATFLRHSGIEVTWSASKAPQTITVKNKAGKIDPNDSNGPNADVEPVSSRVVSDSLRPSHDPLRPSKQNEGHNRGIEGHNENLRPSLKPAPRAEKGHEGHKGRVLQPDSKNGDWDPDKVEYI